MIDVLLLSLVSAVLLMSIFELTVLIVPSGPSESEYGFSTSVVCSVYTI